MRRSVVALAFAVSALAFAGGTGAIAHADEAPTATAPAATAPAATAPAATAPAAPAPTASPAPAPKGTGPGGTEDLPPVDPSLLVERHLPGPEILHEKPSGFWTSNRPAIGGAYRYRLLLLGVAIAGLMAALMIRVVRRHARRADR